MDEIHHTAVIFLKAFQHNAAGITRLWMCVWVYEGLYSLSHKPESVILMNSHSCIS